MNKEKIVGFADGDKPAYVGMPVAYTNGQGGSHFHIYEGKIEKIGNKYVTVGRTKFSIEDGFEETIYGAKGVLYSSRQELERCYEESRVISEVYKAFRSYSTLVDYEQAKQIAAILKIDLTKKESK